MGFGNILDAGSVKFPSRNANNYALQYKRRAFGSVTCTGNDSYSCAGSQTLSFQNLADHTKKLAGGRYSAGAHLTSITTKNVGGGDLSDAALWEIEFQWTAYSKGQLDAYASSFMIPGNNINVNFGWNTGGSVSISGARIYDFSWSYNIDEGSYSCTGKAIGQVAGAMGGLELMSGGGTSATPEGQSGAKIDYSVFAALQNEAFADAGVKKDKDGKLSGPGVPSRDGGAKLSDSKETGIICLLIALGAFSDDRKYVAFVKLKKVIDFINANLSDTAYKYVFDSDKFEAIDVRSADPGKVLFQGKYAQYADDMEEDHNNFIGMGNGTHGVVSDLWISTDLLLDIENSLLDKRSDKEGGTYTAGKFLSKLFGEISNCTGGLVDLISVPSDGKKEIKIVNKMYDIKKSGGSVLQVRSLTSPVKSMSMSSALDPDMAAIAFSGGSGKFPAGMADKIFGGCTRTTVPKPAGDSVTKLGAKMYNIGNAYTEDQVADFKKVLREYVMEQLEGKGLSIRYTIDLNLTCDGFTPKFGQTFRVSEIPSSIGSSESISFMVGEIEHRCDGATWETGIVGYMMVNT